MEHVAEKGASDPILTDFDLLNAAEVHQVERELARVVSETVFIGLCGVACAGQGGREIPVLVKEQGKREKGISNIRVQVSYHCHSQVERYFCGAPTMVGHDKQPNHDSFHAFQPQPNTIFKRHKLTYPKKDTRSPTTPHPVV